MPQPIPQTIPAYLDTLPRDQRAYGAAFAHWLTGYGAALVENRLTDARDFLARALDESATRAEGIPSRTRLKIQITIRHLEHERATTGAHTQEN